MMKLVGAREVAERPVLAPEPLVRSFTVLGLDLGQAKDHSAGVMLKKLIASDGFIGPVDPRCRCTFIRQWENGYDYVRLVDDALDLNPDILVPEFNGVGRVFVDMLRRQAMRRGYTGRIVPIVTAASNARMQDHTEARGKHKTVPKVDIVMAITAMQQRKMLVLPKPAVAPDVSKLIGELASFQMRYSRAANVQFGNVPGVGEHDDLVIAMGLACWWMSRYGERRMPAIFM